MATVAAMSRDSRSTCQRAGGMLSPLPSAPGLDGAPALGEHKEDDEAAAGLYSAPPSQAHVTLSHWMRNISAMRTTTPWPASIPAGCATTTGS